MEQDNLNNDLFTISSDNLINDYMTPPAPPIESDSLPEYSWKRKDGTTREKNNLNDNNNDKNNDNINNNNLNDFDPPEDPIIPGVDDLPAFADNQNKQIHLAIKLKEKRLIKINNEYNETNERINIMTEHLKNVKQEVTHTQSLWNSKNAEYLSEQHLMQISDREIGRIKQDIKLIDTNKLDYEKKLNSIQNFIFRGNETLDTFKKEMNWNQEELEQWALASKQKEEDQLALQKYTRADEIQIKECVLEIEKLTKEVQLKKKELDNEATETQAKQIELDKAADEFKNLHIERQKLVNQWQDTIKIITKRDNEISEAGEQYNELKKKYKELKNILNENKQRLKIQEQNNTEQQSKIELKERQQTKIKQELQTSKSKLQEFKDEVDICKNELNSASNSLIQKKKQYVNKLNYIEELKIDYEKANNQLKLTKKLLEKNKNIRLDAETLTNESQTELNIKENELKNIEKDILYQKDIIFRKGQELFQYRQKEANYLADISGATAASKNLDIKIKLLDQNTLKQQELVYNGEFQIQQMERKVARVAGERSVDETKILNNEIELLKEELDKIKNQYIMLSNQCKKLHDEKKIQERLLLSCKKSNEELIHMIHTIELENESASILLKNSLKTKQDILLSHDLLKLQVKKLKEILNSRTDDVLTLENRKYQLEKSMEEKKKEIYIQNDLQKIILKTIDEERHKLTLEYSDRQMKVKKLQAKFEILIKMTHLNNNDINDTNYSNDKSQAYYIIKAAQKREELQREGDELDDKIRIAEREVKALKNTLEHLELRNKEYRLSFNKIDISNNTEEGNKINYLNEQYKSYQDALFKKKKELTQFITEYEDNKNRLEQIKDQSKYLNEHIDHLKLANEQIVNEVNNEKNKYERYNQKYNKIIIQHRQNKYNNKNNFNSNNNNNYNNINDEETMEEIYFQTQNMKDIIQNVLFTLGQLANEFPEISEQLLNDLQKNNLSLPIRSNQSNNSLYNINNSSLNTRPSISNNSVSRPISAKSNKSDVSTNNNDINRLNKSRQSIQVSKIQIGL